jgi:hypothetical protein
MGAPKGVKELPNGKLIRKEERTSFPKTWREFPE